MFKAVAKHTQTQGISAAAKRYMQMLTRTEVLVGIPAAENRLRGKITQAQLLFILENGVRKREMREAMRTNLDKGMPYSKAYQLYLHENGSPIWRIPPRPVLVPAIKSVKPKIARYYARAVRDALNGVDPMPMIQAAGKVAQQAAFKWFTNPANGWAPNAPSTIEQKGSDKPMIDTGEMRRAIRYVVRSK